MRFVQSLPLAFLVAAILLIAACSATHGDLNPLSAPLPPPIALSGSGTTVKSITLAKGPWMVTTQVEHNESCLASVCRTAPFGLFLEAAEGGDVVLFGVDRAHRLEGECILKVGPGLSLPPGEQVLTVEASGDWMVRFAPATGADLKFMKGSMSVSYGAYVESSANAENNDGMFCPW